VPVAARFSKKKQNKKCLWERRHLPQTGKKIKANPLVRTADPFKPEEIKANPLVCAADPCLPTHHQIPKQK